MERNSGKRGWIYYYDTFRKLAQLTPLERGMLIDLAVPYSMPGNPAFDVEPDLTAVFPDATEDQMRLYRQSWAILAENAQDDDDKLKGKNTRRAYGAFKTNCITKGHIPEEDVIPFEEWEELGYPGWRQWDRLGRPLPPVKPLSIDAGAAERDASAAERDASGVERDASGAERDGQDANYNNNYNNSSTFTDRGKGNHHSAAPLSAGRFSPPTKEEVDRFVKEKGLRINTEIFYQYYTSTGWRGVQDWQAKAQYWDAQDRERGRGQYGKNARPSGPSDRDIAEYLRDLGIQD